MFSKLGLQLYTARELIKDEASLDSVIERLVDMGYTQMQTAGWESEAMAKIAK